MSDSAIPMDCSPPGISVNGIFPARVLEWVAISFSRGVFLTLGSNPGLPHWRQMLYPLSHQGSLLYTGNTVNQLQFNLKKKRKKRSLVLDPPFSTWQVIVHRVRKD